jgi:hypothetical protein
MALKKWGKFKGQFKQLIEYSPINKIDEGTITYDNFGMDVGSTCTIKLEHSIDGRAINSDLTKETTVTSALSAKIWA